MRTIKQMMERPAVTLAVVKNEASLPYEKRDDWQKKANSYRLRLTSENRSMSFDYWQGSAINSTPDERPDEVLASLLSDYEAGQMSFVDFCLEFGYTDLRQAEQVHKACQKSGASLKRVLGERLPYFLRAERP